MTSDRSKQALILSSPSGAVDILSTLLCGWYSDRAVCIFIVPIGTTHLQVAFQGERMLPIVLGLIPTLVGAGLFVGLKSIPQNKGVLLFGKCSDTEYWNQVKYGI